MIQAIYEEHKGRYGYRRNRDELINRGHHVNHKKGTAFDESIGIKVFGTYEEISFV
ncbi:transposase [Paenibacillus sp. FSL H7-689]|nr:transposase [Paenibacillus sp. FSL H7-689]